MPGENFFNLNDNSFYDNVIIDTPPETGVLSTLILGKYVKDAIFNRTS